jgi:hypothetical protein
VVNSRFEICGLGVQESGQNQDPYQDKKNDFQVHVIQIEHVRARLKGLSAEFVLNSRF